MNYKVGQRVKLVSIVDKHGCHDDVYLPPIGAEGVVVRADTPCKNYDFDWIVDFHAYPLKPSGSPLRPTEYAVDSCQLAPLTDPKADAFLELIRKLKPLHEEPKVVAINRIGMPPVVIRK